MLQYLSFFGFIFCFFVGYFSPRKAGWTALLIVVFLGISPLKIVPSSFMPITTKRFAIAVTMGMVLKKYGDIPIKQLFKSKFIKFLVLYTILLLLSSARDDYIRHMFISYIPNVFFSVVLCYLLIKDEKDIELFVKILVWAGGVIGFFIIIEYFTKFNIYSLIVEIDPYSRGLEAEEMVAYRSGFYRTSGIAGSAVNTGYYLAFILPLAIWNYISKKFKLFNLIPLFLIIIGLIFLMTRAPFIAIFTGMIIFMIESFYTKEVKNHQIFAKSIAIVFIFILIIFIAFPTVTNIFSNFFKDSLHSYDDTSSGVYIYNKINRIPRAIEFFKERPFFGYGSPQHAYFVVMNTQDLPAPLIILLAGGIPLALAYLFMLFSMPYTVYKFSKSYYLNSYQKNFLIYVSVSLIIGITVMFSNYVEAHIWVMFMLYISIYKIFYLKPKFIIKNK